jgi:hypothetical protein
MTPVGVITTAIVMPYTSHGPRTVVHLRMTGIRQRVTIVIFINTYLNQKDLSTYPI